MSHHIAYCHADEILDSRGNPTLQVTVVLENGLSASAAVPSGASTGIHEALELRDGDLKRYRGKGVKKAASHVEKQITKAVKGMNVLEQRKIDLAMILLDGTGNKGRLGANAILGVSLACGHAGAKVKNMPLYAYLRWVYDIKETSYRLPIPTMNVLNGGVHAGWLLDFQEFMIVPKQRLFKERVRCGSEVFHALGDLLKKKGFSTLVGDEGGYAVKLKHNEEAFKVIMDAIRKAGYQPGKEVMLAIDPATSEFYDEKTETYQLHAEGKKLTGKQMIALWEKWVKKYPLIFLEDGLAQDDWEHWQELTKKLGKKIALVGDDLFVTNTERLQQGIEQKVGNAILIKVNQIGTLSEAMDAIFLAQQAGYKISVSHRSGETTDTT